MNKIKLNLSALPIAIEEATELLNHAIQIDELIQTILEQEENQPPIGKIICANILIGLSIEIYLKAFMIAGRENGIKKGHELIQLYKEFPPFLKTAIENKFKNLEKKETLMIEVGCKTSIEEPQKPKTIPFDKIDFNDFNTCLEGISNIFVDSRYYFENINTEKWSFIRYHFESAKSIARSLKFVLNEFREGKFKDIARN